MVRRLKIFDAGPSLLRSRFKRGARFDDANFCFGTTFAQACFNNFADFSGSHFDSVDFTETSFLCTTSFSNAEFSEAVWFNRTEFAEKAVFFRAKFNQGLRFDIRDPVLANFREAELYGPVFFTNVEFKALILADTKFGVGVVSNSSPRIFSQTNGFPAPDSSADIREDVACLVNFDRSIFNGIFDISVSYLSKTEQGLVLPKICFVESEFNGETTFENRIFGACTEFTNAKFKRAPKFHGCELHQDTTFYATKFYDNEYLLSLPQDQLSAEVEKASRAFRTLKFASETARGFQEQAFFFAHEERRNRMDPNTSCLVKAVSIVYDSISEYGRNYLRPAAFFIISSFYFFFLYLGILSAAQVGDEPIQRSLVLTIKQIVRPFWIWSESAESIPGMQAGSFFTIQVFASMQSFLGIVFVALLLLALRRRFKIN